MLILTITSTLSPGGLSFNKTEITGQLKIGAVVDDSSVGIERRMQNWDLHLRKLICLVTSSHNRMRVPMRTDLSL